MSSTYRTICVSHTPALVSDVELDGELGRRGIAEREGHPDCDLVIGRWSGALIEVGCPGDMPTCHHAPGQWVDDAWLRVAAEAAGLRDAAGPTHVRLTRALGTLPVCWHPRLAPLRAFLRREDGDA